MTIIPAEFLTLEKRFWSGGPTYYRKNVDQTCLVAFPEMSGVMENAEIAAAVAGDNRWRLLAVEERGFLKPCEDVVLLAYVATAERGGDQAYRALVSTAYARRQGGWKMVFHSQTPLDRQ